MLVFLGEGTSKTDRVLHQMERIGKEVLAAGATVIREPYLHMWDKDFEGVGRERRNCR